MKTKDSTEEKFVWPAFEFAREDPYSESEKHNPARLMYKGKTLVRVKRDGVYYLVRCSYTLNATGSIGNPRRDFFMDYFYPQFKIAVLNVLANVLIGKDLDESFPDTYFLDENQKDD